LTDRNPAILQVGRVCDAGESKEEPLILRPRRANGHGTGRSGPRVPSVFVCLQILHDDDDRGFKFDNTPRSRPWPC